MGLTTADNYASVKQAIYQIDEGLADLLLGLDGTVVDLYKLFGGGVLKYHKIIRDDLVLYERELRMALIEELQNEDKEQMGVVDDDPDWETWEEEGGEGNG
jgi:hypothetical protein